MKVIRERAEARWLPSRHRFALFRLHAWLRLRLAKPEPAPGLLLMRHPDQTAFDTYAVSAWTLLTMTCFVYAALEKVLYAPVAAIAALPIASLAIQFPIVTLGLLVHSRRSLAINSRLTMLLFTALAVYFARWESWVRFAGWQFLVIVALNAVAALIMLALRTDVERLEALYGGVESAV